MSIKAVCILSCVVSILLSKAYGQEGKLIEFETSIGVLQFIHVSSGPVQVGRRVGTIETIFRSIEPKRLNEGPCKLVAVDKEFWLMKRKITNQQFVQFLNENPGNAKEFLRNSYRLRIKKDNDKYMAIEGTQNEPTGCISLAGAEELAKQLSKSTGLSFRLPSEAEFMLASVGTNPKNPIHREIDRSNKESLSYSKWSNGFEEFLSPIGEWMTDENSKGERLLKRCLSSLYEREYYPPGNQNSSFAYGVRLVLESTDIESNKAIKIVPLAPKDPSQTIK